MADTNELKNMIRKGTVQSVNAESMKARVKFGDKGGIVSGELYILTRHSHKAYITEWIPEVGDFVLCLMIPEGDGEGYIVGKVM